MYNYIKEVHLVLLFRNIGQSALQF